jgi:hypothetical protein
MLRPLLSYVLSLLCTVPQIIQVVNKHYDAKLSDTEFLVLATRSIDGAESAAAAWETDSVSAQDTRDGAVAFVRADVEVSSDGARYEWSTAQGPAGWLQVSAAGNQRGPLPTSTTSRPPSPVLGDVPTEEVARSHATQALSPPIHAAVSMEGLKIPATPLLVREIKIVTAAMLQLRITDMLTWTQSDVLKQQACKTPSLLVGYQVRFLFLQYLSPSCGVVPAVVYATVTITLPCLSH